jgi:hypothetical protein
MLSINSNSGESSPPPTASPSATPIQMAHM